MPIDFVTIDTTKRLGTKLRQMVDALMMARDMAADLNASIARMNDGTNYARVEAEFGIPPGNGAALAQAIAQLVADLGAGSTPGLLARLG